MNNENDKILDDLIHYYDDAEDDLGGETTVIPAVTPEETPIDETFGDTVVVNVKPQPEPEATTVINVPNTTEPDIPEDEVFGNLDIDGKVINEQPTSVRQIETPRLNRAERVDDTPPPRKTGIWYALKPLWATIIVCAMLVASYFFYVTDTGIIGIYKSNFSYNFSLIMRVFGVEIDPNEDIPIIGANPFVTTAYAEGEDIVYSNIDHVRASIPFTGADSASFKRYDDGVVCVKSNYLCFIDQKGNKKWEYDTQISNPILSVSGDYIAIAGKGSTHLDLYKGKKLVYAIDIPDRIRSCSVSEKGDVVLVTKKTAYKGGVSVFNKNGEEVFSWISGVNYIASASMLKSRNVAVSLISTENAVKSFVMMFDIYDTDPINGTEFPTSLVFDTIAHKNTVYVSSDNSIASVNKDGELNYSVQFDNMDISHIATDHKGWRAVSYTDGYIPYINVYNRNGDLYASTEIESVPEHIDLYKSVVLYNNGRDVICGVVDNTKARYSAPMTIKNLIMLTRSTYMIVYENSLEIIKI